MKRRTGNKKVARAIALALASVVAVTSVPTSITAEETVLIQVNDVLAGAEETAGNAEEYTGEFNVNETTNQATGSGEIGEQAAAAWNNIVEIENAQKSFFNAQDNLNTVAGEVETEVNQLTSDEKAGVEGIGQIIDSEKQVNTAANNLGVQFNNDGSVKNDAQLDANVSAANTAIETAEGLKENVETGLDNVQAAINTANGLIDTANEKKADADDKDKAHFSTQEGIENEKEALDQETRTALENIATTLQGAIKEDELTGKTGAITAVTEASSNAATVAGEKLGVAQNALKDATTAANEAEQHSSDYTHQQMVNVATKAQQAANDAKQAADLADQAATTAKEKEEEAQAKVDAAQKAVNDAKGGAIKVLNEYKGKLEALNILVRTSNTVRKDAYDAMDDANKAIDNALDMMNGNADNSVEGVKKLIETMNNAINSANTAISKVTGDNNLAKATKKHKDTQTRLTEESEKLEKAWNGYKSAKKAAEDATKNRQAAIDAVDAIGELINGKDGIKTKFDEYAEATGADVNDIKALLTSGKTYGELEKDIETTKGLLNDEKKNLPDKYAGKEDSVIAGEYVKASEAKPSLESDAEAKGTTLQGDITILSKKYETEVDTDSGLTVIKPERDKDGKIVYKDDQIVYVLNETYKGYQSASTLTNPDDFKYVNVNDPDDKFDPDESNGMRVAMAQVEEKKEGKEYLYYTTNTIGEPQVSEGTKPDNVNGTKNGKPDFELGEISVNGEKQTVVFEIQKYVYDITTTVVDKKYDNANIKENLKWDYNNALEKAIYEVVANKIRGSYNCWADKGVYEFDYKNGTVTAYDDGKKRTFKYKITFNNRKKDYSSSFENVTHYHLTLSETVTQVSEGAGSYTEKQAYDFNKYEKMNLGGGLTDGAQTAAAAMGAIDNEVTKEAEKQYATDLFNKNEADRLLKENKAILDDLGNFKTAYDNNQDAITAKNKADGYDDKTVKPYKDVLDADNRVTEAKKKADGFLTKLNDELINLKEKAEDEKNAKNRYDEVKKKVDDAQSRLDLVEKKLNNLKSKQAEATGKLKMTSVGGKIVLDADTVTADTDELNKLYIEVNNQIKALALLKFTDLDKYGQLDEVGDMFEFGEEWPKSADDVDFYTLSEQLGEAIEFAEKILGEANKGLEDATKERIKAENKVKEIKELAKKAQDEADRAARALANWRDPSAGSSGYTVPAGSEFMGDYYIPEGYSASSGDDGSSSSSSSSSSLPAAGFSVTSGAGTGLALLPGITETSGVAGARTSGTSGRGSGRSGQGVAGVRTDNSDSTIPAKKNVIAKNEPGETETKVKAKENDVDKKLVKLDDNKVPLDAAPNNGYNLYILFLLLAAGIIAFFTVYTYNRNKKKAALAEEMKKYKN